MQKFTHNLLILFTSLLVACSSSLTNHRNGNTDSLAGLKAMASKKTSHKRHKLAMSKIREMALKETALSLGAQAGLAWRAEIINQQLTHKARALDTIYAFDALTLDHNILPPVLLEGRNTFDLANTQTLRVSDRTYKVAKQARFITTPPNWRQYLWFNYKKPEQPNVTLLPKTKAERIIWNTAVTNGWKDGIEQANVILAENIARLKEDFVGMILYRKLLAMNMVSAPFVSNTDLGITGDNDEIHIDDRVLRITALPALNKDAKAWRAAVSKQAAATVAQFDNLEKQIKNTAFPQMDKKWQSQTVPLH